jgi:hypothetical protein
VAQPGTGQKEIRRSGRQAVQRTTTADIDPLKASDVVAGWIGHTETWKIMLPQRALRGESLLRRRRPTNKDRTTSGLRETGHQREEEQGRFLGGRGGRRRREGRRADHEGRRQSRTPKSGDGSTDTLINFLVIRKIKK